MIIAIYIPRRRVVKDRRKPTLSIGIGSKVGGKHIIFLEIDGKNYNKLYDVIRYLRRRGIDYVVSETSKGFHIIGLKLVTWRELNKVWSDLKVYLDRKWVNLQRLRGFAILRVCGKYKPFDIKILDLYVVSDLEVEVIKFLRKYIKLINECEV
jgi:hypothetical protein